MAHPIDWEGSINPSYTTEPTISNNNNYKDDAANTDDVILRGNDDVTRAGNRQPITTQGSNESLDTITRISGEEAIIMAPGSTLTRKDKIRVYRDFMSWEKQVENAYKDRQSAWFRIWKDKCVLLVSYFIGIVTFIVFFHIQVLPELPFPVIRNLEDWNSEMVPYIWWRQGALLVEIMWGYTHLRRTLFVTLSAARLKTGTTHTQSRELIREHDPKKSRILQRALGAGAIVYHVVFGVWLGWAHNVFCGYLPSDIELVLAGLVSFGVGELTVTIGESYFVCKRIPETKTFRNLRLAAEIFIWAGFALVSSTLPAILVFLGRFALLAYFLYIPERPACVCSSA